MSITLPHYFLFGVPRANLFPCHPYLSAGPLALLPLHFQPRSLHKFQSVQLPKKINDALRATRHMKFRLQLSETQSREVSSPHREVAHLLPPPSTCFDFSVRPPGSAPAPTNKVPTCPIIRYRSSSTTRVETGAACAKQANILPASLRL